jgi:carboxypeptidase family protein
MKRLVFALLALTATLGTTAAAQELRGTVRDSASGLPIPGAVLVLHDAAGNVIARNITGDRGQYRVALRPEARRIQVLRLGFRPRELSVPALTSNMAQLDVAMVSIPTLLEGVRVVASTTCPRTPDRTAAFALLDQARAGLLATVVAREANPASVIRVGFDRTMDANGDRIVSQKVRLEAADRATVSFNATHSALEFVQRGFMHDSAGRQTFFGPDADVLLDEGFVRAYCFHILEPDRARPAQIGLGFSPASRRDGRVDIAGALWIDTVARVLKGVEFRYLGLVQLAEGFQSGGRISFNEVAKSITLIDRWSLRLVGAADTTVTDKNGSAVRRGYTIREVGGELARAAWPDGRSWESSLGSLRVMAMNGQAVVPGTVVGLVDTDYRAAADSAGNADIRYLVPGPYSVMVVDPRLAEVGITLPTPVTFVASRDSTIALRLDVPTAEAYVAEACRASGRVADTPWLLGRVVGVDGNPVGGARWTLNKNSVSGWRTVADGGATASTGLFHFCRNLTLGETVQIQVWRSEGTPAVTLRRVTDKINIAKIVLPTLMAGRGRDATRPPIVLSGSVTDSSSGAAVADAQVTLQGTPLGGITDSTGRFVIGDVLRGDYVVEIRTPSLDSLGAVHQSMVRVVDSTSLSRLFVPTTSQVVAAMCGVGHDGTAESAQSGVLVGRVDLRGESGLPANTSVVAEWTELPSAASRSKINRARWVKARTDSHGTFRMCGVPVDAALVLRTETDSSAGVGGAPVDVRIPQNQRFARADLTLQKGVDFPAVFTGAVITDSTGAAIPDVEVVLTDLGRSIMTNEQGGFRISDVPAGTHKVLVRRMGYAPAAADIVFLANETVEHRIALSRVTTIAAVEVTEQIVNKTFEENRRLGLGTFFTRADLEKQRGRQLSSVLATVNGLGMVIGTAGHAYIAGKRAPATIPSQIPAGLNSQGARASCGATGSMTAPAASAPCPFTKESLRDQGIYCPDQFEERQGISCACYAQVFVDGRLMNNQRPTEPFDLNSLSTDLLEGIEFYSGPSQTPSQYATLNATCGVLVVWTRRSQ